MSVSPIPDRIVDSLTDLTPQLLQEANIRFLMLDFDNTIVPYTSDVPRPEMERWLRDMLDSPIGICVVSNSKKQRVVRFCEERGIPCITHSRKPFSRGIRQCMERFSLDPATTALAGDQIYTDVLGANAAGISSVLVTPIHLHNIWLIMRHWLELPFIAIGKRGKRT